MLRIMQDAKKQIVYRAIGKKELEVWVMFMFSVYPDELKGIYLK